MRALLKRAGIIPLIILYILLGCVFAVLPAGARLRRVLLVRNTSFFSRVMLALLGIRVHVKHRERLSKSRHGRLIVANHLSYTDVFVIASLLPSVFITSAELRGTPLLGTLARLGGSLFVERRRASGLKREIALIVSALNEGFPVILFPEGTTSNGDRVHAFKNSLFDAAVLTKLDILPLCLRYTRIDGGPVTSRNRDSIFYHGGTTFSEHVPRLLALRTVDVEVVPLKTIKAHAGKSRKDLAAETHHVINAAYQDQA
jgi:1-acyl-sn-glycerol-3-phosphate acyltransferase